MASWIIVCNQPNSPLLEGIQVWWDCPTDNHQVISTEQAVSGSPSFADLSAQVAQLSASSGGSGGLPPAEDVAALWSAAFSLPLILYMVARSLGALINFIRKG